MANFINKNVVREYIETNHKKVSNCSLTNLEVLVFSIVLNWIRFSKNETLDELTSKMIAKIKRKERQWEIKVSRGKVCYVKNCKRYEKESRKRGHYGKGD